MYSYSGERIEIEEETCRHYDAVRKISLIHPSSTEGAYLSLNDSNDLKKHLDVAERLNVLLASSGNL